jgi:hypothetical protein
MTNKRPNKYLYLWIIQGNYGAGFEDLCAEETWKECRVNLRAYRLEEPQYAHRVIRRRELNPEYQEPNK